MKEDLLNIINHYSVIKQLKQFNEEAYELIEAIRNYEEDYIRVDCDEDMVMSYTKAHIAEEIADVLNMVEQFMYYYNIDIKDVIEIKHQKIHRQLERIRNER